MTEQYLIICTRLCIIFDLQVLKYNQLVLTYLYYQQIWAKCPHPQWPRGWCGTTFLHEKCCQHFLLLKKQKKKTSKIWLINVIQTNKNVTFFFFFILENIKRIHLSLNGNRVELFITFTDMKKEKKNFVFKNPTTLSHIFFSFL